MSDLQVITLGRVNLDLYAQQHDVPFVEVAGWDAMVGGSPVNVAIGLARLGVRAGVLTAVGQDLVGDWVLRALAQHAVDTRFVARKAGSHTSLALRAQRAPDHPLAFYRHDPADIHLTPEDVSDAPLSAAAAVLVSADALARGRMQDTCETVLARAAAGRATVYLDLDLREVSWPDRSNYAPRVSPVAARADVVLGTEEEFATLLGLADVSAIDDAVRAEFPAAVAVVKRGGRGATVFCGDLEALEVAPFVVAEASTVGAGDAFAAGLIAARLDGEDWRGAGRRGSACAALTVSRFGCSVGFPDRREVAAFLADRQTLVGTEQA